jgi:hypothetical protein
MATEPLIHASPPRLWRRRWRLLLCICALGVATVAGLIGWQMFRVARARAELQQVLAELDRDDPGWRIEAIDAARATVPDDENSVPVILRARRALPRLSNDDHDRLKAFLASLSPNIRLTDDQYRYCIDQLEAIENAVSLIRPVARMPRGTSPTPTSADGSGDLPLVNEARWLRHVPTHLLVLVSAHEGDAATGLRMCVVNLHIAAAIGDEPFLASQMSRSLHVDTAIDGFERLLGQMEIPAADLAAFHAKLNVEAAHDPWPIALRGERAWQHQSFEAAALGILPPSRMRQWVPRAVPRTAWSDKTRDWIGDRFPANLDESHVWCLRRKTQLLRETIAAPWHERAAAVATFTADEATASPFAHLGFDVQQMFVFLQNDQARLQCAIAAISAERYRLRHGHWPDSLAALVPEFLPAVAVDPFDGQPLRYKRLSDGVVIYTVGPDLTDNGGNLAKNLPAAEGTDIGFRLWDVASRGQAPKVAGAP